MMAPAAFGVAALSPLRVEPVPVSPLRASIAGVDDWDQCPTCGFILVACDCDAPKFNLESKHAA